nr:hypothetical protein [Desulfobulbaceae bacterium]
MKITSETYYPEDASALKDIGRYTSATFEYSSLVLSSVFERGSRSFSGVTTAACPSKSAIKSLNSLFKPFKQLGKQASSLVRPFTWTARQVAEVGERGVPVHLDKKSIAALQGSMQRIEERLANIEKNGLSFSGSVQHPTADDFKEKPSKEKNMLLRAVLEDSKHTLDD